MKPFKWMTLVAPLLLACGGTTPQAEQAAAPAEPEEAAAFDPSVCQGLWFIQVANGSAHMVRVAWAPDMARERTVVGTAEPHENLVWHVRSPEEGVPEVWVHHEGMWISRREGEGLAERDIGIVLGCEEDSPL